MGGGCSRRNGGGAGRWCSLGVLTFRCFGRSLVVVQDPVHSRDGTLLHDSRRLLGRDRGRGKLTTILIIPRQEGSTSVAAAAAAACIDLTERDELILRLARDIFDAEQRHDGDGVELDPELVFGQLEQARERTAHRRILRHGAVADFRREAAAVAVDRTLWSHVPVRTDARAFVPAGDTEPAILAGDLLGASGMVAGIRVWYCDEHHGEYDGEHD